MTRHPQVPRHIRVVIVGAGRGGLATAYALQRTGMRPQQDFIIIDEGNADASHTSESSAIRTVGHSALPGIRPPGNPKDPLPTEEFARYLESYSSQLGLTPIWQTPVTEIRVDPHGHGLHVVTSRGQITTRNIVVTYPLSMERNVDGQRRRASPNTSGDRAIPGVFVIDTSTLTRPRSLRSATARAARTIARRP